MVVTVVALWIVPGPGRASPRRLTGTGPNTDCSGRGQRGARYRSPPPAASFCSKACGWRSTIAAARRRAGRAPRLSRLPPPLPPSRASAARNKGGAVSRSTGRKTLHEKEVRRQAEDGAISWRGRLTALLGAIRDRARQTAEPKRGEVQGQRLLFGTVPLHGREASSRPGRRTRAPIHPGSVDWSAGSRRAHAAAEAAGAGSAAIRAARRTFPVRVQSIGARGLPRRSGGGGRREHLGGKTAGTRRDRPPRPSPESSGAPSADRSGSLTRERQIALGGLQLGRARPPKGCRGETPSASNEFRRS